MSLPRPDDTAAHDEGENRPDAAADDETLVRSRPPETPGAASPPSMTGPLTPPRQSLPTPPAASALARAQPALPGTG